MESAEDFNPTALVETKGSKKAKISKRSSKSDNTWCEYHESNTHNTADCSTLRKLKASKNKGSSSSGGGFKNKTWKRKSDDASSYSKKELTAIAKKAGKKAVRAAKKELHAVSKRKASECSSSDDSDDSSVHSLNALEQSMEEVNRELAAFNFEEADKMMDLEEGEIDC